MLGPSERPTRAAVARRLSGRPAHDGPTRVGSHHTAAAAPSPGQCSPQPAEFSPKRVNTKQSRPAHWHGPQGTCATGTHTAVLVPRPRAPSRTFSPVCWPSCPWSWPSGPRQCAWGPGRDKPAQRRRGRGCTGPKGPGGTFHLWAPPAGLWLAQRAGCSWGTHARRGERGWTQAGTEPTLQTLTVGERGPRLTWGLTAHLGPCVQRAWWALWPNPRQCLGC